MYTRNRRPSHRHMSHGKNTQKQNNIVKPSHQGEYNYIHFVRNIQTSNDVNNIINNMVCGRVQLLNTI